MRNVAPTMKAVVVLEPNRVEIQNVPTPTPGPNEVLARVRAVSICGTDAHLVRGDYPGFWPLSFPFIPGHGWAGEIVGLVAGAARAGGAVGRGPGHGGGGGAGAGGGCKAWLRVPAAGTPERWGRSRRPRKPAPCGSGSSARRC